MKKTVDVLVVGGGPAGTATALVLARWGHSTLIIERSNYENQRIGETLPPAVQKLLVSLGLWEQFLAEGHSPSFGIHSVWGRADLDSNDFIFNPYGRGWHVDRARLDAMLARAAENAGAKVYRAAQPISIQKAPNDGWRAEIASGGDRQQWRARFVVDATGRTSAFARKQGAIRTSYDHLVAAVAFFTLRSRSHASDSFTVVEAVENGWWYSASLPDRRRVVAFMTDADLYAQGCRTSNDYWLEQLLRTEHTKSRLDARALDGEPRVFPANSSRLDGMAGTNWLAVGDAAMAFDPLSSQGVRHALKSGIQAAQSIHRQISGDEGTRLEYVAWLEETFDRYVALRSYYYRKEQRWPASLFWIRRHAAVVARKASVLTS